MISISCLFPAASCHVWHAKHWRMNWTRWVWASPLYPLAWRHLKKLSHVSDLSLSGLVTPYGDIGLGQHWFRWWLVAWWHQAITWTNVDLSSVSSSYLHLMLIFVEIPQLSNTKVTLKITCIKFHSSLPWANELTHWGRDKMDDVS